MAVFCSALWSGFSPPLTLFAGTQLGELTLSGNPGTPFQVEVGIQSEGDGKFQITVPIGAPSPFEVPVTVTNGTIDGTETKTIRVPYGTVASEPVVVTRSGDSTSPITATLGAIAWTLPMDHGGYTYSLATTTTVEVAPQATIPGTPTDLTAQPDGPNEIVLAWTAPEDDPTAPTSGYRIEVSTDGETWTVAVTNTASTDTTYMHARRVAGTTYYYRVRAVNAAGPGAASNEASAMTTALTGVCDRTPAVVIEIERATATDCSLVSANQLAAIIEIDLVTHAPTALLSGDFGGMSGLTTLDLGSGLSALPADLLAGLTSLTSITARSGSIATLPSRLFAGRHTLTTIDLNDNPISSLPDGIFAGLAQLGTLDVSPTGDGVTLPLTVELRKIDEGKFRAVVPAGAPFDMVLPITVTNGALPQGTTSVTVPAGTFESANIEVVREGTSHEAVTVNLGTFPTLPDDHAGYALTAHEALPLEVLPAEGASVLDLTVTTTQGPFGIGDEIAITVSFDKNVTVDTTDGTPYVEILVGRLTKQAGYVSGSETNQLRFQYTVQAGDSDTDGISIATRALKTNRGTILSGDFEPNLGHRAVPTIPTATVDGIVPTLLAATVDAALITLTYDETVRRAGNQGWPFEYKIGTGDFSTVCGYHIDGRTVKQTLCAAVNAEDAIELRYEFTPPGAHLEDLAGNDVPAFAAMTIDNVTNATAATITGINITSDPNDDTRMVDDGTYAIGDTVDVTVTFDRTMTVNTASGTPELELDAGGSAVPALYSSGSTSSELVFTYTVAQGDEDIDGIAIGTNKLSANGGIIASNGKNADLAHLAQPANAAHKVDGVRPTMTNAVSSADGTTIVVTFSEPMSSSTATYTLHDGDVLVGDNGVNTADVTDNAVTLTLNIALTHGESLDLKAGPLTARDAAGNTTAEHTQAITDGVTAPAAYLTAIEVSSTPGDDGTYVSQDTVQFTATFNNTVTVTGTPQLKFNLGGTANEGHRNADYASGSPGTELVFEYTVRATDESTADGIGIRSDPINLNAGNITRNGNTVQLYRRSRGGDGTHRVNYAPPVFASAATASDGMSIVLTFDQTLRGSTISKDHFSVTVDGETASLSGRHATISGATVTLSLTDTLIGANTVTVRYTDPTDGDDVSAIQDLLGNDAASFTAEMVTNTVVANPPDAPTGLTATTTRTRDVTLDWTAPSDTGSTAISGYQIEVSTDSGVNWGDAEADTGSTDTTYKHEGLTPNTRYDYRVSAINADGAGAGSTSINTTTATVTISSIAITSDPDKVSATPDDDYYQQSSIVGSGNGNLEVTVTFTAAVDVQTPTGSKAVAVEIAGQTKLATYSSGTGTTALVYTYTIEAGLEDRDGISFGENPLRGAGIVTKDKGAGFEADLTHAGIANDNAHKVDSKPPTLIRAEAAADRQSFTLIFDEPIKSVEAYLVINNQMGDILRTVDSTVVITGNIATLDQPFPNLAATTTIDGVDTVFRDAGFNGVTETTYPFTTVATPPTAPQNLTALPGNGRVTLTWDAPESDGGRVIDSYESRYSSDGGNNWSDWTEIPDSGPGGMNRSRYRVMGLTNGTTYTLELRAVTTADGDGAAAQTTGMPREPGAIGVAIAIDPTSPIAEDVGTVTVTVTAKNNEAEVPEAGVAVTVSTANGTATAGEDFESLSETVTFAVADFALVAASTHWEASEDLTLTITEDDVDEDDETFEIRLAASGDSASEVSLGAGITVTITDDDEVPGAPSLTAEAGDAEVTIEWTAPANAGTSTIDGYDYRVGDAAMTWDPDWTAVPGGANATSYTVTMYAGSTLANGTSYTFEVRARSAAGGGPEAQATTTPGEVCGRTPQIRDAIVGAAPVSACGDVTAAHLAAITALTETGGDIPALKSGDFAGLSAMTELIVSENFIATLPADIFAGLSQLEELHLAESSFAGGTLPQGVFSGLSALRVLKLGNSGLRTLPGNVFSELSALEELDVSNNELSELPPGLFAGLSALTTLRIHSNELSELPAGLLSGLTSLTGFHSHDNTVNPLAFTVALEKVGENGFRAHVLQGAPFDIVLLVSITGGTIDGGATSLTVSKGSVESATLEVTRTPDSTDAVAVDIGTLPGLPTGYDPNRGPINGRFHRGYELTKSDDLPLDVVPALMSTAVTLSIDPASPLAEDVGTVTVTVTAASNTATAPTEVIEVTLSTADGTTTAGEDFEALSETVSFAIADFALVSAATHYEASKDVTFTITDDDLDEEDETFTIQLAVSGSPANEVTVTAETTVTITDDDDAPGAPTLTAQGGYEESTLEWTAPANEGTSTIEGYDYRVSTDTTEPYMWDPDWTAIPDSGDGGANATSYTVTMHAGSALVNATTYTFEVRARSAAGAGEGAQATAAPNEVCGRTRQVREAIVAATPVSACADVTATHLAAITGLNLSGKSINAVKSGDFASLTGLNKLELFGNSLTTLPADIFSGLTALTELWLNVNHIETLPTGVFDDLTAVRTMNLNNNRLTGLPANVFDNLTELRWLGLGANGLTALGMHVFQHTGKLEQLALRNNPIQELPAGLLSGTPRLTELYAYNMGLNALPAGLFSGLTDLEVVWLHGNPGAPLGLTVSLAKVGTDEFKATIREGAPFEIQVPITASGGTIEGAATTITIPTGAVESATLEVTRGADPYVAVTVDIGSPLPVPPNSQSSDLFENDHSGYALAKASELSLVIFAETPSTTINLTVDPAEVAEDAGETTLTVTAELDANSRTDDLAVTVTVGSDDDTATVTTDYTAGTVPTLTITGGERSGTTDITFTPVDDTDGEGDETVTIAGTVTVETLTVNGTEVTIIDDDATPVPVTLALTSDPDTSGPDDDTYAIGNVIEATATFSGTVTVTGTPQLELDSGGAPKLADCALATDTTKLACTYTVAEGDEDTDGIAIEANKITLNGAVITLGTDAVTPTHDAVSVDSGHKVDGVRPELTDAATSADGTKVVLTYDQTLSATTAATGAFTVTVSSANIEATTPAISAVAASDETVTLTIGTAVKAGQTVTVDYTDPTAGDDANAVQDAAGNDAASIAGQAVTNTVPEDATVSALSVALSAATLTEGGDAVTVTVTIAASATFATDRSVALAWGGEALAPNAGLIREPSGRSEVLIAAGESSATATLVGVERAAYTVPTTRTLTATFDDADETAIGTGLDLTYMDSGSAPAASISATPAMVPEGDDITVEVTLTRAFDIDVAVTLTMADTEGVVSTTAPTSIDIAANETTGTVTLSTTADMMTGADASVVFTLGDATNEPYSLGTPATVTVTVLDDTSASDEITLSVAPATVDEDAGAITLTVTATLNRGVLPTATDVTLSVAAGTATATTDYTATTATLTIAANAQSGTTTLTLTPVNDTITEPDETVTVEGTASGFTVIGTEVSILDADEPAITLSFVGVSSNSIFAGEENGPLEIALKAVAAAAPTRDVLVRVHLVEREGNASVETGDFKPFDKTYTFIATDFASVTEGWVQTVSADLELIDDETVEKIETVDVHVDTASLARHVAAPEPVEVFITDNDTATVGFAATSYQVEEADEIVIEMTTSAPIAFSWSVVVSTAEVETFRETQIPDDQQAGFTAERAKVQAYATSDDDYYHLTDVLHTAAFETNEITVGTVDDVIDDDDEALLIVMVSNGLDEAITINPKYAFVTIVDDDQVPDAPTALTVDNAGPTTVTLSWTAPSNEGTQTITAYLVERSTDSNTALVPSAGGPPPYYDEDLTPETRYHYRVSAISAAGTGRAVRDRERDDAGPAGDRHQRRYRKPNARHIGV